MADKTPVSLTQDGYAAVLAALGKRNTFIDITKDAKKLRNGTHKSYSTVSSTSADKFWTDRKAKTDRSSYEFVVGAQIAGEPEDLVQVLRTAHLWLGYEEVPSATSAIERSRDPEFIVQKLNDAYGLDWVVLNRSNAGADGELREVLDGLKTPATKRYAKRGDVTTRALGELAQLADAGSVAVRVGSRKVETRKLTLPSGAKKVAKKPAKKAAKTSLTYMTKLDSNVACSVRSASPSPKQRSRSPARRTKSPTRSSSSSRVSMRSEDEDLIRVIEEVDGETDEVIGYLYEDNEEPVPRSVPRDRLKVVKRFRIQPESDERSL